MSEEKKDFHYENVAMPDINGKKINTGDLLLCMKSGERGHVFFSSIDNKPMLLVELQKKMKVVEIFEEFEVVDSLKKQVVKTEADLNKLKYVEQFISQETKRLVHEFQKKLRQSKKT